LAIAQEALSWQPMKVGKSAFFAERNSLLHCDSETNWNLGIAVGSLEVHLMWLHRVQIGGETLEKHLFIFVLL